VTQLQQGVTDFRYGGSGSPLPGWANPNKTNSLKWARRRLELAWMVLDCSHPQHADASHDRIV
jgi:hypothetical protein